MSWPIIAGGSSGGGGGGGGATGVAGTATTGEIAAMGTEDLDIAVDALEVGDLVDVLLTQTAGGSTRVALELLDSDGNSRGWPLGSQFGDLDASSAPLVGPRVFVSGANYYLPMSCRSSTEQLHLRVHNRDNLASGTFQVDTLVRPVTTA